MSESPPFYSQNRLLTMPLPKSLITVIMALCTLFISSSPIIRLATCTSNFARRKTPPRRWRIWTTDGTTVRPFTPNFPRLPTFAKPAAVSTKWGNAREEGSATSCISSRSRRIWRENFMERDAEGGAPGLTWDYKFWLYVLTHQNYIKFSPTQVSVSRWSQAAFPIAPKKTVSFTGSWGTRRPLLITLLRLIVGNAKAVTDRSSS